MSIVKVVKVMVSPEQCIDDALHQVIAETSKTIHNINSVYVKDTKAHVKDGKYRRLALSATCRSASTLYRKLVALTPNGAVQL